MKFLVIWKLDLSLLSPHVASAVARMPAYARPLERTGQVAARYHIVGAHGGAWVYDVGSKTGWQPVLPGVPGPARPAGATEVSPGWTALFGKQNQILRQYQAIFGA